MSQQEPIHVVVEKKGGCLSGCGTALALTLLLGLTIQYWYVALPIVVIVALAAICNAKTQRKKDARKPGPRDPWLNEVAIALADLGLKEIARNTGAQLGGAPIDGDIGVQAERFLVYVTLFSDQRLARQAELGLRAKLEVRDAMGKGATAIRIAERIVFVANGRGTVVDEFQLDEVVRTIASIALPPPLPVRSMPSTEAGPYRGGRQQPSKEAVHGAESSDALAQLEKLAKLHAAGALTDDEFRAKKAELLGRI